jgi:hypothetical protein
MLAIVAAAPHDPLVERKDDRRITDRPYLLIAFACSCDIERY